MSVIEFKPKAKEPEKVERYQWRCGCGCVTFYCNSDASIECASCGTVQGTDDNNGWRRSLPDPAAEVPEMEEGSRTSIGSTPELAKASVLRAANGTEANLIAVIREDGGISLWTSFEDKGFILPLLDDVKEMVDRRITAWERDKDNG